MALPCTKRSDHELGLGGKEILMLPHLGFWRAGMLGVWGVSGALANFSGPRPVVDEKQRNRSYQDRNNTRLTVLT